MDVADHIVVMDQGHIEQQGSARDLYEHPANDFVMSFIGPVTRFGDGFVRPHELEVLLTPVDGGSQAIVERVVYLGFEVRVELRRDDGVRVWAQLPRDEAARLALSTGQAVSVRSRREAGLVAPGAVAA